MVEIFDRFNFERLTLNLESPHGFRKENIEARVEASEKYYLSLKRKTGNQDVLLLGIDQDDLRDESLRDKLSSSVASYISSSMIFIHTPRDSSYFAKK